MTSSLVNFKTLLLKDINMNGVTIKNVPFRKDEGDATPRITGGVAEKIQQLSIRASGLKMTEIDFSYDLKGGRHG